MTMLGKTETAPGIDFWQAWETLRVWLVCERTRKCLAVVPRDGSHSPRGNTRAPRVHS